MNKKLMLVISLLSTIVLSACGSSTDSMGMSDSSISSMPATGEMTVENKISADRSIIKTSSLNIRVKNVEKSVTEAQTLAATTPILSVFPEANLLAVTEME